ncbi:hypothetical protein PanWU01x14_134430 [Parasponia andersonii]|uniref:Uncharacterized protein n=1 Tax=Parasponia andersonii TaxID=3476 RepID=A0A2P5CPR4_PARAD|nr:hypothetical protein PanWU01x14_134430 [Parasponia andersonii]
MKSSCSFEIHSCQEIQGHNKSWRKPFKNKVLPPTRYIRPNYYFSVFLCFVEFRKLIFFFFLLLKSFEESLTSSFLKVEDLDRDSKDKKEQKTEANKNSS